MRTKTLTFILIQLILIILGLELSLRWLGHHPYRTTPFTIESQPQFCLLPDSLYGIRLNPGQFNVSINGLQFHTTHLPNGQRITPPPPDTIPQKQVHLYGCSFPYGFGLDDSLSYPYRLQQARPNLQIHNKAVPGYGTIQAFHQLQHSLAQKDTPDIAIIHYASFHDERNALSPQYRKALHISFQQANPIIKTLFTQSRFPYLTPSHTYSHSTWSQLYQHWPLREQSSIIHYLQNIVDAQKLSPHETTSITQKIFRDLHTLCQAAGIQLIIAGITQDTHTQQMLLYCDSLNIPTWNLMIDMTNPQNTNAPHDDHPNANSHAHYTQSALKHLPQLP